MSTAASLLRVIVDSPPGAVRTGVGVHIAMMLTIAIGFCAAAVFLSLCPASLLPPLTAQQWLTLAMTTGAAAFVAALVRPKP